MAAVTHMKRAALRVLMVGTGAMNQSCRLSARSPRCTASARSRARRASADTRPARRTTRVRSYVVIMEALATRAGCFQGGTWLSEIDNVFPGRSFRRVNPLRHDGDRPGESISYVVRDHQACPRLARLDADRQITANPDHIAPLKLDAITRLHRRAGPAERPRDRAPRRRRRPA